MHNNETIIMKQLILTVVAMAIVTTIGITTTMTTMAYADPNNPTADENVHDHTPGGFRGAQDQRYHEGTCQGGSDSEACDLDIIDDPGNSDDNRQNDN
jgi:hypothetical protein